jgi:hypothetical protein
MDSESILIEVDLRFDGGVAALGIVDLSHDFGVVMAKIFLAIDAWGLEVSLLTNYLSLER